MKSSFPILLLALADPARAIALTGLIPRLKQEIPHARITLVTTKLSAELFQDEAAIDEVQAFEGAIFNLKALGALAEISRRPWGLLVDVGPSMISRMIRSKTRIVVNGNEAGGPLKQICQALAIAEGDVTPRLAISPEREARAQAVLEAGRITAPVLAMAPGAGWLGRRWPTERYAVLATRLMRDEGPFAAHNLVILGNESDRDTAVALSMATPRAQVMELTGKLDLLTAGAVLKGCAAFVGNDEIWLRLAAAAGIPTFGLYGPSDEADAPPGDNMFTIRGPRSFADIRAGDPKLKMPVCHMLDLTIDKVYDGVEDAMARLNPRPEAAEAVAGTGDAEALSAMAAEDEIALAEVPEPDEDTMPAKDDLADEVVTEKDDVSVGADETTMVEAEAPQDAAEPEPGQTKEQAHAEEF
ncbi:MAG: glycosyltransferase family 9 protein [Asticcacaulis sp.]|nr:glycosyltransferase family 9 protein [Asticcacaulis sp.]